MPVFLVQVEEICDRVQMLSQTPVPLPPCHCAQGLAKVYRVSGLRGAHASSSLCFLGRRVVISHPPGGATAPEMSPRSSTALDT